MTSKKDLPVNLDSDAGDDLWNLQEVAESIVGDNYSAYGMRSKLQAFLDDESIETPKPALKFRGGLYWEATEATTQNWVDVIEAERAKAEAKAWTKGEMLEALRKSIQNNPGYHKTKRANAEEATELAAVLAFIQNLGDLRVESDTVEQIKKSIAAYQARS